MPDARVRPLIIAAGAAFVLSCCLSGPFGAGVSAASGHEARPLSAPTIVARGSASPGSSAPMCSPGDVRVEASTNHSAYPPGEPVVMRSSVTNTSDAPCVVAIGFQPGSSPAFLVQNSDGKQVWSRCWNHDEPAACTQVFHAQRLRPGQTYKQKATWDQKSGPDGGPVVQVPQGEYTYTTFYAFLPSEPSVTFDIIVG
jgi:Intracellular proteinase inhibitor